MAGSGDGCCEGAAAWMRWVRQEPGAVTARRSPALGGKVAG